MHYTKFRPKALIATISSQLFEPSLSTEENTPTIDTQFLATEAAIQFFSENPTQTKLSRKNSQLLYSFLKITTPTHNTQIIAISRQTIGKGSQGKVKLGYDVITKKKVAIKIKVPNEADQHYWYSEASFLKELGQLHGTLTREDTFKSYIVSDFFSNSQTLKKHLKENPNLSKTNKLKIILKIIEQLELIHEKNIVHGDLNFNNILINNDEKIKIIDFGYSYELNTNKIAKFTRKDTGFDEVEGKLLWLAPERDPWKAEEILTEIESSPFYTSNIMLINIHKNISQWIKEEDYGFYHTSSDVYSLGYSINRYINPYPQDPDITNLYTLMCKSNPFERLTLEEVNKQCNELLMEQTYLLKLS
jgi:serine/threonine protein kinase